MKNLSIMVNQKTFKNCQNVFLSSLDGLVQTCMTLSQWFLHETAALYQAVHQPIVFSHGLVLKGYSIKKQE